MITIEASVSKAWLARALGVAFDRAYYFDPLYRHAIDRRCHEYTRTELADLGIFHTESNLGRRAHHDDAQALVGGIQPNLILGMLLGAEFLPHADMDADISPRCLEGTAPEDLPEVEALLDHELVRMFDEQIASLPTRGGGYLVPVPPFFWDGSGRAAVHGSLTTAQKFLGEDFLADLLVSPVRCQEYLTWITEATIVLVRHFSRVAGVDVTELHVGECSACLVSPAVFRRFVAPTLERYAAEVAPLRLHSCGPSDHLLRHVAPLPRLVSLDLGGETSVALARETCGRELSLSIAPPVTALAASRKEPVLEWARRVLDENDGGDLVFLYHLEPQYDLRVVRALHAFVTDHGA